MASDKPISTETISTVPLPKQFCEVSGLQMAYFDSASGSAGGAGDDGRPVVFVHGNPTSSYLWRNVIPHVSPQARCIAPDLIGHGDSGKIKDPTPTSYRYFVQQGFFDEFIDQMDLGDEIVFVLHDWGAPLAFNWAMRHPERVAGIAYSETVVRPLSWSEWPEEGLEFFQQLTTDEGVELVINQNLFVEAVLPAATLRDYSEEEMAEYRRPYPNPDDRWPTLLWPREVPFDGEPADMFEVVSEYGAWLGSSDIPKLLIIAEPGAMLTGAQLEFCRAWPNTTEVTVAGRHYTPEDSPHEFGQAIASWLAGLPGR